MNPRPKRRIGSRRANRGVVLFISLIVLVAMTLGGIAILRSVDTTTLIAGNMAFKQRALHAADVGVNQAVTFLLANKALLDNDIPAQGYYSSQAFDWTAANAWSGAKFVDVAGEALYYKIHRMCTLAGTPYNGSLAGVPNQCGIDNPNVTVAAKPVEGDSFTGNVVFPSTGSVYYRVTVKSTGRRNTESYIQAMVLISI